MTSEYTELSRGWWGGRPDGLLQGASHLLWDFDGPLCRLFASRPARDVVVTLCNELVVLGLPAEALKWWGGHDPHALLRSGLDRHVHAVLEDRTAAEEEEAAATAAPTPLARRFARLAFASGWSLAITTNNAPQAVTTYLKAHDLDGCFGSRIFGRVPGAPHLMKPHPDCLLRAMEALGAAPQDCLMIGDSPMDARAAAQAHVPFLGYARHAREARRLQEEADVAHGVVGMRPLMDAARRILAARHGSGSGSASGSRPAPSPEGGRQPRGEAEGD